LERKEEGRENVGGGMKRKRRGGKGREGNAPIGHISFHSRVLILALLEQEGKFCVHALPTASK